MSDINLKVGLEPDFNELKKKLSSYKGKKVNVDVDADTKDVEKLKKELNSLEDVDVNVNVNAEGAKESSDGLFASLKGITSGFTQGGPLGAGLAAGAMAFEAISGVISDTITESRDFNNALLDQQAKLSLSEKGLRDFEQSAKEVFVGGVGESVAEATRIFGVAEQKLGSVFKGEELAQFTTEANALGNLFELEVTEVITKAEPFIKQFGLSGVQATNLLAKGLREAGTAQEDVIDTLSEYSQLAVSAGFSAETFTQTLVNGAKEGIFNTDKLGDSIKEAQIRIQAGDFRDAFKDLGTTGAEKEIVNLVNGIAEAGARGEITVQEVLQKSTQAITESLNAGEISKSFATQLQVGIAGTPAEDIGTDLFNRIFSAEIDPKIVAMQAQAAGDSISRATGQYSNFEAIQRQLQLFLVDTVANISDAFDRVIMAVSPTIDLIVDAFTNLIDAFSTGEENATSLGDIIETYLSVALNILGQALSIIINTTALLVRGLVELIKWFSELDIVQTVIGWLSDLGGAIGKLLSKLSVFVGDLLNTKDATEELADENERTVAGVSDMNDELVKSDKPLSDFTKNIEKSGTASKNTKNALELLKEEIKKTKTAFELAVFEGQTIKAEMLAEKIRELEAEFANYEKRVKNLSLAYGVLNIELSGINNNFNQLGSDGNAFITVIDNSTGTLKKFKKEYQPINQIQFSVLEDSQPLFKTFNDNVNDIISQYSTLNDLTEDLKTKTLEDILNPDDLLNVSESIDNVTASLSKVDFSKLLEFDASSFVDSFKSIGNISEITGETIDTVFTTTNELSNQATEALAGNTEAQRAIAITQATINIALGVAKAIAAKGFAGILEGVAISAFGALQLANIRGADAGERSVGSGQAKKPSSRDVYPYLLRKDEAVTTPEMMAVGNNNIIMDMIHAGLDVEKELLKADKFSKQFKPIEVKSYKSNGYDFARLETRFDRLEKAVKSTKLVDSNIRIDLMDRPQKNSRSIFTRRVSG